MKQSDDPGIYRMRDLIEVTGWTRKRLSQWLQQGIVVAEQPPRRQGCAAGFTFDNIVQFMIVDKLVDCNINIRTASSIASETTSYEDESERDEYLQDRIWVVINLENTSERKYFPYGHTPEILWDVSLAVNLNPLYKLVLDKLDFLDL
jgi:hypothetical protein